MPRNTVYEGILKVRFDAVVLSTLCHLMVSGGNATTLSAVSEIQQRKKSSTSQLLVHIAEMSEVPLGSIIAEC